MINYFVQIFKISRAKSPDPSSYSSYEKPAPTIKVTTNLPKNINTNQSIPTNPNHNMIRKPPLSQNEVKLNRNGLKKILLMLICSLSSLKD